MNIKMKVSLGGYKKKINRIIEVNDKMTLEDFCEAVVISMNGLLEHAYMIKHMNANIRYLPRGFEDLQRDNEVMMKNKLLKDLNLQEKDELYLEYDNGDGWEFYIEVEELTEDYKKRDFTVLSGSGKGIIEDCGGPGGLEEFINKTVDEEYQEWYQSLYETSKPYDVNDFNANRFNKKVDDYFKNYKYK